MVSAIINHNYYHHLHFIIDRDFASFLQAVVRELHFVIRVLRERERDLQVAIGMIRDRPQIDLY